jgi:hypothetical protein
MLQKDQTAPSPSDTRYQPHTVLLLMAAATALVGYIMVYLAFFDSTGLL